MPGGSPTPGPLVEYVVETIADGVSCLHVSCQFEGSMAYFSLRYSLSCGHGFPKAPAKRFAEHGDALQEELGSSTSALHSSTRAVVKGTIKNASRQYQNAVRRLGMAMILGLYSSHLGLVPALLPSSFSQSLILILPPLFPSVGSTQSKEHPRIDICASRRRACYRDALSSAKRHIGLLAEGRSLAVAWWIEPWTGHK